MSGKQRKREMLIKRKSGILLHITSLPSTHGIGDLGPFAFEFVDFLEQSGQRLWQLLPFNPTQTNFYHSPYSSTSAFAGNTLLLSPDLLVKEGLINAKDIKKNLATADFTASATRVNFEAVKKYKEKIFSQLFSEENEHLAQQTSFVSFCEEHAHWLDDFALFEVLNEHFQGVIWSEWPKDLRDKKHKTLAQFSQKYGKKIQRVKFFQFLFFKQWLALKRYCHSKKIQIIGDLPLYVNYHSAEVWAHPELFRLDKAKNPAVIAGVPPDYFSADGQLWNNPIYDWSTMKAKGFDWWVHRIEHNLKLYDWIRLDHFRGFASYWEVPAHETTAKNGKWQPGPGKDLFNVLLDYFPTLPIIAEDLGDIDAAVRELRDEFMLPGMRVLQFAFGEDTSSAIYKPHNYISNSIAYTGTHDNNTLIGWLMEGKKEKKQATGLPLDIQQPERVQALKYTGAGSVPLQEIPWYFIKSLMGSSAAFVIFPMQDLLGLDEKARMNLPGTTGGNWEWRLTPNQMTEEISKRLKEIVINYERI
jgi:4-alpha-glucanotransferase